MFGLVKPYVPELRVRENELYRAVYCGLCRELGASCGRLSPLGLSYDFVFLALCCLSVSDKAVKSTPRRCAAHPFAKRQTLEGCSALTFSAMASAVLTRQKLADDLTDEHGWRKLKAAAAVPVADRGVKKSRALEGFIGDVAKRLRALSDAESLCASKAGAMRQESTETGAVKKSTIVKTDAVKSEINTDAAKNKTTLTDALVSDITPDTLADLFGDTLGCVFEYGADFLAGKFTGTGEFENTGVSVNTGEFENSGATDNSASINKEENFDVPLQKFAKTATARIFYDIGYRTGRFIYLTDAALDFAKDKKSGSFNAFGTVYKTAADFDDGRQLIRDACLCELLKLENAVALLDCNDADVRGIIDNIVTLGMPAVCQRICENT